MQGTLINSFGTTSQSLQAEIAEICFDFSKLAKISGIWYYYCFKSSAARFAEQTNISTSLDRDNGLALAA